jgi:deazaflavin-dependent oxidoreductase (nitroreductase family)
MSEDNKGVRTFVKRFVNPVLRNVARLPFGPFALLRHVGRRSGKKYEIPIMVWPVKGGFVIELTYGRKVDWLRNLQAAAQGSLRYHQQEFILQKPRFIDPDTGWRALPGWTRPILTAQWRVLRMSGEREFVLLPSQPASP